MHVLNFLLATEDLVTVYRDATGQDDTLQQLKRIIQAGWPGDRRTLPVTLFPYFHIRDELVVEDGLIFRGHRLVIPKSLRRRVTDQLHASHQGVASTLRRARELVFWPNMSAELKDHISMCDICCALGPKQLKETLVCHDVPDRPWAKIETDLFEVRVYNSGAASVIRKIKAQVARYGIPDEIVSDQGPQFMSREFKEFVSGYGIRHVMTSPYHHQANGKVEVAVKQAKRIPRVSKKTGGDPYLPLLTVRNTPQEHFETSPAQRLMSRRTKTDLPTCEKLLRPQVVENFREKDAQRKAKQQRFYNRGATDLPPLDEGTRVRVQPTKLGDHERRPQPFSVRSARDPTRSRRKAQEPTSKTGNVLRKLPR